MPAAVLTIDINARLANLEAGLVRATSGITAAARKMEAPFAGLNKQLVGFGTTALAAFGVPLGIAGLVNAIGSIVDKTTEGERALHQLDAVLKATGNSAGLTKKALDELGQGIQGKTIFDDDAIRAAETALLRFRDVQGEVFKDAMRLAPDVATVLGVKLPEAAIVLGRALSGEGTAGMKALKAAGVQLSEQNIDLAASMTEAGDKAGSMRLKLDEIQKSVGGAAEADNTGLYGASKRLTRAWDDLVKTVGHKIFADNTGSTDTFTAALERMNKVASESKIGLFGLFTQQGAALQLNKEIISAALNIGQGNKREVSGKIGGQPDPAEERAAAAAEAALAKQISEQQYIEEKAALKRRADNAATYYGGAFALLKASLDEQSAALDFSYQQNEISSAAYYAKRRAQAEADLVAQRNFLAQQAEAQAAIFNAPDGSATREERLAALEKIRALANQGDVAAAQRNAKLEAINRAQALSVEHLIDDYAALNVQLLEVSGNTVAAANAAFVLAHKDRRAKIAAELTSEDPEARSRAAAAAADLDRLQSLTTLQARLNDATKTYSLTLAEVGIAERDIASALEAGSIGELDSLRLISEARAGKLGQLRAELAALQAIAVQSGKREDIIHVEELRARLNELAATGDLVAKKFNEIGSSSLSDALQSLANGQKSFKQAALDFGKSITEKINKVAADQVSDLLFKGGGPLSGFGDFFSKMFGGKGAGDALGATGASAGLSALSTTSATTSTAMTTLTGIMGTLSGAATSAATALASVSGSGGAGLGALFSGGSGSGQGYGTIGSNIPDGPYPYATGTSYLPRDMIIKAHKGERITPANQNRGSHRASHVTHHHHYNTIQMPPMGGMTTQTDRQRARTWAKELSFQTQRG